MSLQPQMTLKIEKDSGDNGPVIRLAGRLRSEHLSELKMQLQGDGQQVAFDLAGITLVDVEAVRFLNACAARGVELMHCPAYVREWMMREKV